MSERVEVQAYEKAGRMQEHSQSKRELDYVGAQMQNWIKIHCC